jgi:ribonuclease D
VILERNDLAPDFLKGITSVAIDTEAMGLMPHRDRLCLAQFSKGDGESVIVQFENYDEASNIKSLLHDSRILKIFHYARFDIMMLYKYLGVMTKNIYCTKIASKLARTYTQKHSLADLCRDLLSIEISKEQTCTDWGARNLTSEQLKYAANDVLHLHAIKDKLDLMLIRENRMQLAESCFTFLEARVIMDLMVGESYDIFSHGA